MAGRNPGSPKSKGPLCGARKLGGDGTCRNSAGERTSHPGFGRCWRHGGSTPGAVKQGARLMIEDAAQTFGIEVETTAEDALLRALNRSYGYVLYYRERCADLQRDAHIQGTERIQRVRRHPGTPDEVVEDITTAKTTISIYLQLLSHWEAQHFRIAAKIAELQIEAGRVRLQQEQAELFYDAFLRGLELFGISRDDDRIPDIIPRIMGEIAA